MNVWKMACKQFVRLGLLEMQERDGNGTVTAENAWRPGASGGINLYAYVQGDPLGHVDPDGRMPLLLLFAIGAGVDAVFQAGFYYLDHGKLISWNCLNKSDMFVSGVFATFAPSSIYAAKRISKGIWRKVRHSSSAGFNVAMSYLRLQVYWQAVKIIAKAQTNSWSSNCECD